MKKFVFSAAAFLVVASAAPAAAELKIGYIVTQRLMQETKLGKDAQATLKGRLEDAQKKLDGKLESVKKLEADVEKRMAVLNEDEKKKLGDEYEKQLREAKRMKEDYQRDLSKAEAEVMGNMTQKLRGVIEKFAKENGYDLILDASVTLYVSGDGDVTDEILAAADKAK
ncbi:MAG TPA: OmpH family outer membrane protein [Candidatus Limnocylindrales bacterium]|nr:OmpH family outer membrane protein [Candidatus Limnocylindrales bacterium]